MLLLRLPLSLCLNEEDAPPPNIFWTPYATRHIAGKSDAEWMLVAALTPYRDGRDNPHYRRNHGIPQKMRFMWSRRREALERRKKTLKLAFWLANIGVILDLISAVCGALGHFIAWAILLGLGLSISTISMTLNKRRFF